MDRQSPLSMVLGALLLRRVRLQAGNERDADSQHHADRGDRNEELHQREAWSPGYWLVHRLARVLLQDRGLQSGSTLRLLKSCSIILRGTLPGERVDQGSALDRGTR